MLQRAVSSTVFIMQAFCRVKYSPEGENREAVDVIGENTMTFLEFMELMYENLPSRQLSKQIPGVG